MVAGKKNPIIIKPQTESQHTVLAKHHYILLDHMANLTSDLDH